MLETRFQKPVFTTAIAAMLPIFHTGNIALLLLGSL